jgi:hypothetical protein
MTTAATAATAPQTHYPPHWERRTLVLLDAPANHENQRFMTAWGRAEGGNAKWNPLNSTLRLGGTVSWTDTTDYNSIGVKNYSYGFAGIAATALTMQQRDWQGNPLYGGIVADLKNGTHTAEDIVTRNDTEIKLWGTNPDLILEVLKSIP